ncbi:peptidoglycan DD-metalloendopeptidase family protein [Henriciella sp.]|uniref:peptidoglycan DD-metalloendopeptidase family protein n=1 Tax=Henriciella sp. TaxID=1968823 RepID=UPI00260F38C0|nr:peptidoglycan DD-metalloendopeptidase family protein [Henriciella sp.]
MGLSIMAGTWIAGKRNAEMDRLTSILGHYHSWLAKRRTRPAEVISGLHKAHPLRLDRQGLSERGWDDLPLDWIPENGAIHMGGYGEERAIYDTHVFAPAGEEPRTVHLGLDIFAPAQTPVFAPLDGTVHSLQRNDNPKDYGPTLILEHAINPELTIYTLYGHLAADVLDALHAGKNVTAGHQIAALGAQDVNGGWAPHLHFQVILDLQGRTGDYPGVAKRSDAADWLQRCPDPGEFFGLSPA